MTPTVLHLFAGSGGCTLGFQRAGFRSLGSLDFDAVACRDLERLTGGPAFCRDIAVMEPADLRDLTGGECPDVVVMIECRPATEIVERFQGEAVTIFADPPYPEYSARGRRCRAYRHEMLDESDHRPLLEVLRAHRGPVVACSYRNALYDGALLGAGWEVVEFDARAEHGVERTEALYLNQAAVDARAQMELGGGMWGREGRPT